MTEKMLERACQVLRRRVLYTDAGFTLDDNWISETNKDTERIRKATRLYVETWILPIVDAIEAGDAKSLKEFTTNERGLSADDALTGD
jgi:hypothetical protein